MSGRKRADRGDSRDRRLDARGRSNTLDGRDALNRLDRRTGRDTLDRRTFLKSATAVGAGAALPGAALLPVAGRAAGAASHSGDAPPGGIYSTGIWSGDPKPDSVVLGTRVEPFGDEEVAVRCQLALTPDFTTILYEDTVTAGPGSDYTVKVKAGGLDPDAWYYYRFIAHGTPSPVGRTHTAPDPSASPERLRVAFCSCQDFTNGVYTAWRGIAREDLDFVLFLGDYIYETSGDALLSGRLDPITHASTLDDYRKKYRLYRSDPDLQAAHANFPLVPIWDDHEVHNNYDKHADPDRRAAAYQAWFEFMPLERHPSEPDRIYRTLQWGSLAELFLLDTRQYRDPEAKSTIALDPWSEMFKADRSILGADQKAWLKDGLAASTRAWKVLGNQVTMMPWRAIDFDEPIWRALKPNLPTNAGIYVNGDSWDGYQHERTELLTHLESSGVDNFVILTGDVHSFWAAEVRANFDAPSSTPVGFEFVGGSISSAFVDVLDDAIGRQIQDILAGLFKEVSYVDVVNKGYGVLDLTPDEAICELKIVDHRDYFASPEVAARFRVVDGGANLERLT